MIDVNELRKGVTFTMNGALYKVLEYQHHKPGRGKATIRTTLRNVRTGATVQHNFNSGDRVEDIRIDRRGVQYLYTDGELYHFMDTRTYEQSAVSAAALGDGIHYITEGIEIVLSTYEEEAIDVELPTTVDLKVVEAEMAVAGDTATGTLKKIKLETGLELQVPLFIVKGNTIRVDTRTGEYVTRV
ncbi:MAG: elongation factor P [Anaerolineales bacterium]|nr:MAG: elongation factor P [Anaerolineales bacterium]